MNYKGRRTRDYGRFSANSQLIRLFERSSTPAADNRRAVAAHQGVVYLPVAGGAVERFAFGPLAITHPFTFLAADLRSLTLSERGPLYEHGIIPLSRLMTFSISLPSTTLAHLKRPGMKDDRRAETPLQLVADLPQEFLPHFDIRLGLDSLGFHAVDDA